MRRLRAPKALGITAVQQAVSLQAASLLLGYPEPELVAQVPLLRAVASDLPEPARLPLERMCDHLETTPVPQLWRYRYDKFGWTTRSSQLYERRLLRWGSPLFHFGILAALGGHVVGLLIPKSATEAVGISETMYHVVAVGLGGVAGFGTVVGLALLIYRRRTVGPVLSATTKNDKLMYVFLAGTILLGLATTVNSNILGHHDYRETVAPYFRSIFYLQPQGELMTASTFLFEAHVMSAWLLFAIWPFTRLVHVFSAPLGYLTRPYIPYRSREHTAGSRPVRPGWEPVGRR